MLSIGRFDNLGALDTPNGLPLLYSMLSIRAFTINTFIFLLHQVVSTLHRKNPIPCANPNLLVLFWLGAYSYAADFCCILLRENILNQGNVPPHGSIVHKSTHYCFTIKDPIRRLNSISYWRWNTTIPSNFDRLTISHPPSQPFLQELLGIPDAPPRIGRSFTQFRIKKGILPIVFLFKNFSHQSIWILK